MGTEITRPNYERRGGRYASDLTDRAWALIAPFMPPRKKIGRPRTTDLRHVMDAVMYMAATGCQWAMLPNDFPPPVNGGAKLVHPGGAKLVHLMLCGTRCWGVVPVVHRRDPRCFV